MCRLENELKSLQEQLSSAPKQHQLDSVQSAMTDIKSSLQQARGQLQEKEEANTHLQEQLVQVCTPVQRYCCYGYLIRVLVLTQHSCMFKNNNNRSALWY